MKEIIPFIKIARALKDNHLWLCEPFSRGQAWVDLVLLANYSEGFFFIRGTKIDLERGQWAGSMEFLGERWKWSRTKVKTFLKVLQTEQQINLEITNIITKLTIINYNKFQDNGPKSTADCKAEIHQKYSRSTAEIHTQKKNKKKEEEKEIIPIQVSEFDQNHASTENTKVDEPLEHCTIDLQGNKSEFVRLTKTQKDKFLAKYKDEFGDDHKRVMINAVIALDEWFRENPRKYKTSKNHLTRLTGKGLEFQHEAETRRSRYKNQKVFTQKMEAKYEK